MNPNSGPVEAVEYFIGTEDGDTVTVAGDVAVMIEGRGGNDTLTGGGGNDTIKGGAGDDIIDGGTGAEAVDQLTGGGGDDRFMWGDGDTVKDFAAGDLIDLADLIGRSHVTIEALTGDVTGVMVSVDDGNTATTMTLETSVSAEDMMANLEGYFFFGPA